ncbi:MAG: hypothetical protein NE334_17745 [Lentisphaeraceae bacterium]|nr:hypothetical protein [Lentisphaeraceae bacterium]
MSKYRIWYGDEPEYKKASSLAEAIKFFRKNPDYDESDSGIEELMDGEWDEWLDEDDQNIHEHLYMYGGKSVYLKVAEDEDDEDFDEDDLDDDLEDEEEEEVEEEEASDDIDLEDRLMNVIGGNAKVKATEDEDVLDDDLEEDDDEDFDEEDEDA